MGTLPDAAAQTLNRRAALLLAGPRGRRLCLEAIDTNNPNLGIFQLDPPGGSHDGRVRAKLLTDIETTLQSADLRAFTDAVDPWQSMEPLSASVGWARYWQEPDETDLWLAEPEVAALLWPVARALAESPANAWWFGTMDLASQHHVQWLGENPEVEPSFEGAGLTLAAWHATRLSTEVEAAASWPRDPKANWGGPWWSTPSPAPLVLSSRMLDHPDGSSSGCVRLALVEDSLGWTSARLWPVAPNAGARIYEIADPGDWVALVCRYPLEVTASRRHSWYLTTGRDERWLMPDWQSVARDYDGVHLQVGAYLGGAGRSLDVDGGKTVLAGFDPDLTYWLTDAVVPAGDPEPWRVAGNGQNAWLWEPGD